MSRMVADSRNGRQQAPGIISDEAARPRKSGQAPSAIDSEKHHAYQDRGLYGQAGIQGILYRSGHLHYPAAEHWCDRGTDATGQQNVGHVPVSRSLQKTQAERHVAVKCRAYGGSDHERDHEDC